jgi:hypothetical protein
MQRLKHEEEKRREEKRREEKRREENRDITSLEERAENVLLSRFPDRARSSCS